MTQHLDVQEEQLIHFQRDMVGMAASNEGLLTMVSDQLSSLTSQLTLNTATANADTAAPATLPASAPIFVPVQLARPEKFSRDSGDCRPLLSHSCPTTSPPNGSR